MLPALLWTGGLLALIATAVGIGLAIALGKHFDG
jgi:hypothetical protein